MNLTLDVVFVLFSITSKRFNPALVGVFATEKAAKEAETKMIISHNHTTCFVLELPVCHSLDDYMVHWKSVVTNQVIDKIVEKR